MSETVVVLGASPKQDRYSNRALRLLVSEGYRVIPVNPAFDLIEGIQVKRLLSDIKEPVDTITMYVGPSRGEELRNDILSVKPRRVIFNPGSESPALMDFLKTKGVEVVEGCTLVMLRTEQF